MSSDWIYYFGYGSLVNRETRPADELASPARLKGWRRVWEHRIQHADLQRRSTSMSIEPMPVDPAVSSRGIDGVVVRLEKDLLPVLDQRESGYERLVLPADVFELPAELKTDRVIVYRSLPQNRNLADDAHPVLQSYVDCIMAGYQRMFGDNGLQDLISSTRGWERPVLNDRRFPRYPRSVIVDQQSLNHFDASIRQHLVNNI